MRQPAHFLRRHFSASNSRVPNEVREQVTVLDIRAATPGIVGARTVLLGDRTVMLVEVDGDTEHRGALGSEDAETFRAAVAEAVEVRVPLVAVLNSSGADLREGVSALHGWGRTAQAIAVASGLIPIVVIATGPVVSGQALLLGLADHVVLTERAAAFVSGPHMVRSFTGTMLDVAELGGVAVHAKHSGVASLVVAGPAEAMAAVADLLTYLPDHSDATPPRWQTGDPSDRLTPEAFEVLPATPSGSYDVRALIRCMVDDHDLLELRSGWATNLVTGFATLGGRPIGVLANQPQSRAGTLDIEASQKGARFVSFCDAFGIPLLTLVDTPGFFPGKDLEWKGMIRHGAQLAFAYARATVPRVSLTLRKSYGGAYIVMDSKTMGNDLALAWPTAQIAVMGSRGAVEILHRGLSEAERVDVERGYEERLLNPYIAAERGLLDAVIDPADTRQVLVDAFDLLGDKREALVSRKHDNSPL